MAIPCNLPSSGDIPILFCCVTKETFGLHYHSLQIFFLINPFCFKDTSVFTTDDRRYVNSKIFLISLGTQCRKGQYKVKKA